MFDAAEKDFISVSAPPYDTDPDANRVVEERRQRLRLALRAGGGNKAVAQSSGVNPNTLNEYIKGRDLRLSYAAAIAKACNVSLEWLATGEGPMFRLDLPSSPGQPGLLGVVNSDRLAAAMQVISRRTKRSEPDRDHALAVVALYDVMAGMSDQEVASFLAHQLRS